MPYIISSKDINLLKSQIKIDEYDAKELLIKHNGDIVECVLDNYNFKDNISKCKHLHIEKQINNKKIKVI